jgi:SSS family solute:Na+ symporter
MGLGLFDAIVLFVFLSLAIWIGVRASKVNTSVEQFMLGNRDLPWWAILGSIVATETSTATVLSLPASGFGPTGMAFLQLTLGYFAGRLLVIQILLPLYYQGKLFSAYEVLQRRFGFNTARFASLVFLVTRNLGDGLRLFLASLVLHKLMGWNIILCSVSIGGITMLYSFIGGMRSVVWNDCVQMFVYLAGGIATLFVIAGQIDGGWSALWDYAGANGKLQVIHWRPPLDPAGETGGWLGWLHWILTEPLTLWGGVIGGGLLSLGTHGTDQMMVQRYLSARSQRDASWAIFGSVILVFLQFALFLFIGVQLSCYYDQHQAEAVFSKADEVYAHFLLNSFPKNTGLIGLMLAAILAAAMSTLSSSLNSSATAVINDFYLPACQAPPSPASIFRYTRWLTVGFGILQILIGVLAIGLSSTVVQNALTIAGYSAGLLLGMFLLALGNRRANQGSVILGALCGLIVLLLVQFVLPATGSGLKVAWLWYALIGSCTTFVAGSLLSPRSPA